MSKSKKTIKRKRASESETNAAGAKKAKSNGGNNQPLTPPPALDNSSNNNDPKSLNSIISSEELEITIDTLQTLTSHPAAIKSKACRSLRSAVFDFRQACTTGANTSIDSNLTSRISGALVDAKYTDALVLLAEMRIRGEAPKLGALCRWVRDLDVTSGLSEGVVGQGATRSERQVVLLRVLDAIARVTGTTDVQFVPVPSSPDPIAVQQLWDLHGDATSIPVRAKVESGTIFESCAADIKDKFRVLDRTPGSLRKPPNLYDAVVYLSADNAVPLSTGPRPEIIHHRHPFVPNLSLMQGVFSTPECEAIVAATESVGFLPDAPVVNNGGESSILAHNVYWMIDEAFHAVLWERVSPFIPAAVGGRKARSINRRFRVYRYVPGAEYRVHYDGGWPPSGVDPATGKYVYDASPEGAKQTSLFTFLVYLNDDFEGGETTFFTPSLREGVLNAYPVKPVMGSVALFPHGESRGALLHEGTGVRKGAKYIIRTDVEYDVEPVN